MESPWSTPTQSEIGDAEVGKYSYLWWWVVNCDQNLRESSMNVISRFTICMIHQLREWQFPLFFVILNEKLAVISHKIAQIMGFHNLELKWNVIQWNASYWAYIFREREFTEPSFYYPILLLDLVNLESPILKSRKIWVIDKFLNFHAVQLL